MRVNLGCLMMLGWINVVGIALPYPVLPPLFMRDGFPGFFNLSGMMSVMIVLALYPLGQFIGSPLIGAYSDRHGARTTLKISMALTALGYLISAYCIHSADVWGLAISRLFTGFAEGNHGVLSSEVARISNSKKEKIKNFGLFNAAATLGWLFGPIIGSWLSDQNTSSAFNSAMPFVFGSLLGLTGVFLASFSMQDRIPHAPTHRSSLMENLRKIWQIPGIVPLLFLSFVIFLAIDGFYEFYPAYITSVDSQEAVSIAGATALITFGMVFSQTFLVPKIKPNIVTFSGAAFMVCIGLGGIVEFLNSLQAIAAFFITGLGIGVLTTLAPVSISNLVPDAQQGSVMGTMSSLRSLGDAGVCLSLGFMGSIHINLPFLCIAILAVSASIGFGILCTSNPHQTAAQSI